MQIATIAIFKELQFAPHCFTLCIVFHAERGRRIDGFRIPQIWRPQIDGLIDILIDRQISRQIGGQNTYIVLWNHMSL